MKDPMQIVGVPELVKSGAFVMSEVLRAIEEGGGAMGERLQTSLAAGEEPMLTLRVLADCTGTVVELVTQLEGDVSFTRHAILPILKSGGSIN